MTRDLVLAAFHASRKWATPLVVVLPGPMVAECSIPLLKNPQYSANRVQLRFLGSQTR
jgi:hypothetical protein